jgi:MerR family transcriptional regulator, mercuric resistance operon regulatory protein
MTKLGAREISIGDLSKQTGVHIETIRYYERIGVMPKPARSEAGRRIYDSAQLNRLAFIKRSRDLGFSLNEVRDLLTLIDGGELTCAEVHALTLNHLKQVRAKLADLRKLERALKDLAGQCSRGNVPECPIVETLYGRL